MSVICPAILAKDKKEFDLQIKKVQLFASRIQVDLMDGRFTDTRSLTINEVSWPETVQADLHLMFANPMHYVSEIVRLMPNMVIIHAEADVDHAKFAEMMRQNSISPGLCLLAETKLSDVKHLLGQFDHLLIFSGHLGHFGGKTDLGLLKKAQEAKDEGFTLEIGWDGGVNPQNSKQIADGGVDVLNVGGFIQNADNAEQAYSSLVESLS